MVSPAFRGCLQETEMRIFGDLPPHPADYHAKCESVPQGNMAARNGLAQPREAVLD